jgi:hypothetical protein
VFFPTGKPARTWRWMIISIQCLAKEWSEIYFHFPYTSSGRGRDTFTFFYICIDEWERML